MTDKCNATNGGSPDEWYERERNAFVAWWESEGQKKFSEAPTLAAGAGWLARAEVESLRSPVAQSDRAPGTPGNGNALGVAGSSPAGAAPSSALSAETPSETAATNDAYTRGRADGFDAGVLFASGKGEHAGQTAPKEQRTPHSLPAACKHERQGWTMDMRHGSCLDCGAELGKPRTASAARHTTLYALECALEKLRLYRVEHSGEYIGGMEYAALVSMLEREIADWRTRSSAARTMSKDGAPCSRSCGEQICIEEGCQAAARLTGFAPLTEDQINLTRRQLLSRLDRWCEPSLIRNNVAQVWTMTIENLCDMAIKSLPPAAERIAPHRDNTPLTWARMRAASTFKGDVRVVEADFAAELEFSMNAALREVDDLGTTSATRFSADDAVKLLMEHPARQRDAHYYDAFGLAAAAIKNAADRGSRQ